MSLRGTNARNASAGKRGPLNYSTLYHIGNTVPVKIHHNSD